jgi:hypothetical protein
LTKRKAKDDGFNTSAPDLIAQFRATIDLLFKHPSIPQPWPAWVPGPESLDWKLKQLENIHGELASADTAGIQSFNRVRRELKTSMVRILRYVEQSLTGSQHQQLPGFDLSRNPGCPTESAAYGSGLAKAAPLLPQEDPEERRRRESEPRKNLVRAVRPMFQGACIEVKARDREDAIARALSSAADIPEDKWTGRNDPQDYFFDVHCVHTGQTAEGHPISLLDFPRYTVVSTNPLPPVEEYAVLDPWMKNAGPILAASLLSEWIDQLLDSQAVIYEDAEEDFQEKLQQWKGSGDQKVLPHKSPEERRLVTEMIEQVLSGIALLKEPDLW